MRAKNSLIPASKILLGTLLIFTILLVVLPGCASPQLRDTDAEALSQAPPGEDGHTPETKLTDNDNAVNKDGEPPGGKDSGTYEKSGATSENVSAEHPAAGPPKEGPFAPNELGEIMILMYHEIGYPEAEWRRTPENFRQDLQQLYDAYYRLVHLDDIVRGEINIARGTTPVVLTFDDGNRGNFNYLEKEGGLELDPDCAVAILEEFNAAFPDFGLAATFYIYYPNPFRQPEYVTEKLNYLVERGFAIGNHTYGHANLSRLGATEIQRELALHQQYTEKYVPGYTVNSLALPYGAYPREHAGLLLDGSHSGTNYSNLAVLLVGSNPAKSPFHRDFNAARLPRVRAGEINTDGVGMYDWLAVFEKNPQRRYVSDGNPHTLTVPASLQNLLDPEQSGNREIIID